MRRALRWLRRILLGLVALVVVAVVVVVIVLHTDWGRERVKRRIEAALQKNFPGSTIGSLTGSVFGTLTLHDITLVALDHEELAKIDTLELELALRPLLGKTARIERLEARGVTVHARALPPPPRSEPPPAWDVELPDVAVHQATVIAEGEVVSDVDIAAVAAIRLGGPIRAFATVGATWRGRGYGMAAFVDVADDVHVPLVAVGSPGAYVVAWDAAVRERRGNVRAQLPAAELAALVPKLPLTGDATFRATAAPQGAETRVVAGAAIGVAEVEVLALVDPEARRGRGVVAAHDGGAFARGRAAIAGTFDRDRVNATVIAGGAYPGYPRGDAVIAVQGGLDAAEALVFATGDGGARVGTVATVKRAGDVVTIERSAIGAAVTDLGVASGGRVPVTGALAVEGSATGPVTALSVAGTIRGSRLRFATSSSAGPRSGAEVNDRSGAATLRGTARVTLDGMPRGSAHVELGGVVNAGKPLGSVIADVKTRSDGRIDVHARAKAARFPIAADVSAVVTVGKITDILLGAHRLDTPAGAWTGSGGRIRIEPAAIVVSGVRTGQGDAYAKVDARLGRGTSALAATVEAHALPVSAIDPRYHGAITGNVSLARVRGGWSGGGMLSGRDLTFGVDLPPVAAGATISVTGRRVAVAVNASNDQLGGARAALEVDAPRDLLDVDGWLRVARGDLHAITIGFDRIDAAALSRGRVAGLLDGTLAIREGVPSGVVHVTGVPTPVGEATADLTLALTDVGFVDANAVAAVGPVHDATASARIVIPDHPFDPRTWRALGSRVVDRAAISANDVAIDSALLERLHVHTPYHGIASAKVEVGTGASSVAVTADVTGITGGTIVRGVDVHVDARADGTGSRGALRIASGGETLAELPDAAVPVTLGRWISGARSALSAPLSGTLTVAKRDAAQLLAIVGRADVTRGTVEGQIVAGGTLRAPTAAATIDLLDVHVAPRFAAKPPPALKRLHVDARWGGAGGNVTITGEEEGSGTLLVEARGRPDELGAMFASAKIHAFDIAPIVVFLPGQLAGAAGLLEVDLGVTGIDAALGRVRGTLGLTDGRFPISPTIGTLRKATARVSIQDGGITAKLDGKLGAGTVALTASTGPDALITTVDGSLAKVAPIGAVQPILDGKLHGTFRRSGLHWAGTATISKASVEVPEQSGHQLLDAAAPVDLVFVDLPIPRLPVAAGAPEHPWLVADVEVQPVTIRVPQFAVDGRAGGKLRVSVGETLGLDGEILVERGSADLFGHRYRVELGQLVFDGTTDGLLDLKLAHDFPDVTTFVRFSGRMSELAAHGPEFTSDPGIYSQGQLLGFFLGGAPGGDPTKQAQEAATGFGAALASSTVGKRVLKYIPLKLEVLRCDPAAGTTSASCTTGGWLTPKIFLSYQHRLEARYDENTNNISSEWHFKPNWELDLSGGDANYYGSDVLWRHRW